MPQHHTIPQHTQQALFCGNGIGGPDAGLHMAMGCLAGGDQKGASAARKRPALIRKAGDKPLYLPRWRGHELLAVAVSVRMKANTDGFRNPPVWRSRIGVCLPVIKFHYFRLTMDALIPLYYKGYTHLTERISLRDSAFGLKISNQYVPQKTLHVIVYVYTGGKEATLFHAVGHVRKRVRITGKSRSKPCISRA